MWRSAKQVNLAKDRKVAQRPFLNKISGVTTSIFRDDAYVGELWDNFGAEVVETSSTRDQAGEKDLAPGVGQNLLTAYVFWYGGLHYAKSIRFQKLLRLIHIETM
jgi:hypothetical protein